MANKPPNAPHRHTIIDLNITVNQKHAEASISVYSEIIDPRSDRPTDKRRFRHVQLY